MSLVGYRKFIVTVLSQVVMTALCALGMLTGGEFVAGLLGTTGAFITMNVVQKAMVKSGT
jgi:hypothetical protein